MAENSMRDGQAIPESELHQAAKEARKAAGVTQAAAAEELGVQQPTLAQAENEPERRLTKLRIRMIEKYGGYQVDGPTYHLKKTTG